MKPSGLLRLAEGPAEEDLLGLLGLRLREARAGRGMTRKLLAMQSQVSERYLAQLEAGQANPSVLVLQKLADALGLPIVSLLHEAPVGSEQTMLLLRLLRGHSEGQLRELRTRLAAELGRADDHRRSRIALTGLRGAGKSTLGKRLAKKLACPFIELDKAIEKTAGMPLSEVFLLYGQAGYRRLERRCLEEIVESEARCVIATGGSIVTEPATYDLLLSTCLCVWLRAAPEEHMARVVAQGDTRPMAGNAAAMEDLNRILDARALLYAQADCTVETTGLDLERSYQLLVETITRAA